MKYLSMHQNGGIVMNKLCVKSALLGAIGTLMFILLMGATNNNINGKYQISGDGSSSKIYLLNTQTGVVKKVEISSPVDPVEGKYTPDF